MNASARSSFAAGVSENAGLAPLWAILGLGFVLRLLFVGSEGFHNDIAAFESWTLTLRDHAPWQFYNHATFADYPPGYFCVLWVIGHLYALLPGSGNDALHGWSLLRAMVKLPAIAMDLVDAGVIFLIVRRYASQGVALLAAALIALNPAAIYVSAYWGQIDSVSWGLILISLLLVLRAGDDERKAVTRLVWAWLAIAFSLLIKPQGASVALLLLAYPFAAPDARLRLLRLRGALAGIGSGLVLAYGAGALFHGTANPVSVFGWLLQRYLFGSGVYPYNSVNAFNLYALRYNMWQPDTAPLHLFGFDAGPLSVWGVVLVAAASALVVARYLGRKDDRALLKGAMLLALAFFVLATRMHERYVYGAFLLSMPLLAFGRSGLWSSVVLSVTMYLNLAYSFAYQAAVEAKTAGLDATNLWPAVSHPAAFANVALFFVLGYLYLGAGTAPAADAARETHGGDDIAAVLRAFGSRARGWFDPLEGIAAMRRLDWVLAGLFTLASFAVCIAWIQYPAERIFDEVYYPRAGEEYLKHLNVSGWGPFEFTHPPFTKLLITLSMVMFGGLHGLGDTAVGWRFLNVVVGALTVGLLYVFAKRLTASTLFASFGALMLLCDGFHFTQSRIATPEITVAFFSLLTLYAFYRLWLAGQIARVVVPLRAPAIRNAALTMGAGVALAALVAWMVPQPRFSGPIVQGQDFVGWAQFVAAGWVLLLFWLVTRLFVVPRSASGAFRTSYPEGTRVTVDGPSVRSIALGDERPGAGLAVSTDRAGAVTYATPAGSATYRPDGTATVGGVTQRFGDARVWWVVLALSSALLADSKWNGLLDFIVIWMVVALVTAQRWVRRRALWGNPFGVPLDLLIASMLVVGGALYIVSYIPYFTLGRGFVDVVAMQHAMYQYHATLVATHPYASKWWQWPLLLKPISYFWSDTRTNPMNAAGCCVAEILALPNPFVWWFGLITVPVVGWLAWQERNKGYALLIAAYLWHWLSWAGSPRLSFEYHFYPNDAIIMLANAVVLQRIWQWRRDSGEGIGRFTWPQLAVLGYGAAVVIGFAYFYPVLAGQHIPWNQWHNRMWLEHWII